MVKTDPETRARQVDIALGGAHRGGLPQINDALAYAGLPVIETMQDLEHMLGDCAPQMLRILAMLVAQEIIDELLRVNNLSPIAEICRAAGTTPEEVQALAEMRVLESLGRTAN